MKSIPSHLRSEATLLVVDLEEFAMQLEARAISSRISQYHKRIDLIEA